MQTGRRARVLVLGLALGLGFPRSGAEPANLSLLKQEIGSYIDSGKYTEEIAAVAKQASAWIERRVKQEAIKEKSPVARLAVVFDLDETMLSNLPHIRGRDWGYDAAAWTAWVARGEAPVIEPVREIFRTARKFGVEVIYISGRRERDRPGTEKNLRAAGVDDCRALLLKPDDSRETTEKFKTDMRRSLATQGFTIIANIGDQQSDLDGGYAEKTFKLPGPFYLTR